VWWANTTRTWTEVPEFWDYDPAHGASYGYTLDWPREVVAAAGHVFLWFFSNKIRRVAPDGSISVLVVDGSALRFVANREPAQGHKLDARSPLGTITGLFADHDRLVIATQRELVRIENIETERALVEAGRYALPNQNRARAALAGMRDGDAFLVCDGPAQVIVQLDMLKQKGTALFAGRPGEAGHRDGPLASALFNDPSHITATKDAWYISDRGNHVVRRIDRATREVSTIGAVGTPGRSDGDARSARFERPRGICAAYNRIWIADLSGAVRCFDPRTHQVSTFFPEEPGHSWPASSICAIAGGLAACSMQPPTLLALPVS